MLGVLLGILRKDENIIWIYCDVLVLDVVEDLVHNVLECCMGICEAKWHYQLFVVAVPDSKSHLPFIPGLAPMQAVGPPQTSFVNT